MIYYIILLLGMLQASQQHEHFDLTWNINIVQSILTNPDTLRVICPDSASFYFNRMISDSDSFINKDIKYIKDNFFNKKDISILEMIVLHRVDEQRNLSGYNCHISFINKSNGRTIRFVFIELEKDVWKIYTIMTDSDKDPFR